MKLLRTIAIPILIVTVVFSIYHFSQPALAETDAKATPEAPMIHVSGTGEISVEPDMGQISLGVLSEGKTAEQAQKENATLANRILTALTQAGIDKKDIQTQNFSVNPVYDYNIDRNGRPQIVGYQVRNTVLVTVKDINKIGPVLDKVREAGVNEVHSIRFMTSKDAALRTETLAQAVKDARLKADTIAKALGKQVDDVVSVSAGSASAPIIYGNDMMLKAEAAPNYSTPIMAGELTISSTVQVQFSMK